MNDKKTKSNRPLSTSGARPTSSYNKLNDDLKKKRPKRPTNMTDLTLKDNTDDYDQFGDDDKDDDQVSMRVIATIVKLQYLWYCLVFYFLNFMILGS